MHIIFESVLMLLTENYQNWSGLCLSKLQLAKVGAFFEIQCISFALQWMSMEFAGGRPNHYHKQIKRLRFG